jgi:hypothetical protein
MQGFEAEGRETMKKEEIENNSPEKMDLRSMDVGVDNRAKLKALFPSVFTETQNERGEPIEVIDFEKLKAEQILFRTV